MDGTDSRSNTKKNNDEIAERCGKRKIKEINKSVNKNKERIIQVCRSIKEQKGEIMKYLEDKIGMENVGKFKDDRK
ncbi:hypothetical protein FQA39_LY16329 [Lamprigera yunnana]|nr:hypothetical protein FQA39_LY16329 [Lamprigera yunnana]